MTTPRVTNESIEFHFQIPISTETSLGDDIPRRALKMLKGADSCVATIEKGLGAVADRLSVDNNQILNFFIRLARDLAPNSPATFLKGLEAAAKAVTKNSQSKMPRMLNTVVTPASYLPILRSLATESERTGFHINLLVDSKFIKLPTLKCSDFTEPKRQVRRSQKDTFPISGYCFSDARDVLFLIGKDRIFLKVPSNHHAWQVTATSDFWGGEAYLEGEITQTGDGEDWHISSDSKLVVQTDDGSAPS